jgi:hypothetical protein
MEGRKGGINSIKNQLELPFVAWATDFPHKLMGGKKSRDT